jgi:hypothetical protein
MTGGLLVAQPASTVVEARNMVSRFILILHKRGAQGANFNTISSSCSDSRGGRHHHPTSDTQ